MKNEVLIKTGKHYSKKQIQKECILNTEEKICLILAVNECTNSEMAKLMSYSKSTIKKFFENIFEKLNVHSRIKAVFSALSHELISFEMCSHFEKYHNISLLKKQFFSD